MQRKSQRLPRLLTLAATAGALWASTGCSTGPCADYDRVRGIVIKGRGAETPAPASKDSLALTPATETTPTNQ